MSDAVTDIHRPCEDIKNCLRMLQSAIAERDVVAAQLATLEAKVSERRRWTWTAMRALGKAAAEIDPITVVEGRDTGEVVAETLRGIRVRHDPEEPRSVGLTGP